MNRQVVPSILLSVGIVCFFAVALYQRDPPDHEGAHAGRGEAAAATGTLATNGHQPGTAATSPRVAKQARTPDAPEADQSRPSAVRRPNGAGLEAVASPRDSAAVAAVRPLDERGR